MKIIVFSKSRPMQLHACLSSLAVTCKDLDTATVSVLYLATDEAMERRYEELRKDFAGAVFHREGGLFAELLRTVCAGTKYLCFVTDDTVFVRPWSILAAKTALEDHPSALGVSLRLGKNCTHSYVMGDVEQEVPKLIASARGDWLGYEWPLAGGDFDYPLELSSSIYRIADLYPLLQAGGYRNPNELEAMLSGYRSDFMKSRPLLFCSEVSIAFANPLNVVQNVFPARFSFRADFSVEILAENFDAGWRFDVAAMQGYTPRAVHELVEMKMVRRGL